MIRAVALDIDGTLTDEKRLLSPPAVEAVQRLSSLAQVILVTGNVPCFTRAAAVLLGTSRTFIAENGGVISWSEGDLELLSDPSVSQEAYQRLKEVYPLTRMDSRYRMTDLVVESNFNVAEAVSLLEAWGLEADLVDSGFAVHIKDRKVNKGRALAKMMDRLGLRKEEVAAVGDSTSDLPMFKIAGFRASVANAVPELKAESDYVSKLEFGAGFCDIVDQMVDRKMF
ncbi:MAG TPA: phosphoglycolate phosphatase [Methanothrix sp.]|nr:phosphoglycolate phosphatase [Methanothrix sp.]HPR66880.1 phosphoglycolate phosphatase [Methanothrix sp.]